MSWPPSLMVKGNRTESPFLALRGPDDGAYPDERR